MIEAVSKIMGYEKLSRQAGIRFSTAALIITLLLGGATRPFTADFLLVFMLCGEHSPMLI